MPFTNQTLDKRSTILCATLELLASQGFHGFSVKQLAQKAGVATGTVYLHFKDREDLIRQLYLEVVHEVGKHLFVDLDASASAEDQYRQICRNFWRFCLINHDILSCKAQFDHLPSDIRRIQSNESKQIILPLYQVFAMGRERGEIKHLPDDVLVTLAIEPFSSLANKQWLGLVNLDEAALEQVINACWDAIAQ